MWAVREEVLWWWDAVVDDEAEHWRCPFLCWQSWRQPLLAYGFVCWCCAWQGEAGVCESGVFDAGAPGNLVADVVWVLVGEQCSEVDWCWGWSWGVACWDREAFCFGAVCVAVVPVVSTPKEHCLRTPSEETHVAYPTTLSFPPCTKATCTVLLPFPSLTSLIWMAASPSGTGRSNSTCIATVSG